MTNNLSDGLTLFSLAWVAYSLNNNLQVQVLRYRLLNLQFKNQYHQSYMKDIQFNDHSCVDVCWVVNAMYRWLPWVRANSYIEMATPHDQLFHISTLHRFGLGLIAPHN